MVRNSRWESLAERMNIFAAHVAVYRLLGGRVFGKNIVILTTMGRRTGRTRSTPLYCVRDGDDYVVIASNGGEDRFPGWWYNIRADPRVEIQVGREIIPCTAVPATADDEPRLFDRLCSVYRGYRKYANRTSRELTIFRLKPLTP